MKKLLYLTIALLLAVNIAFLASCSGKGGNDDSAHSTSDSAGLSDGETDRNAYYKEKFGSIDMNGKEVWVYDLNTSPDIHINYYDDFNGDPMNVKLYERDMTFNSVYGITIEYFSNTAGSKAVSNSVLSGSYLADIIYGRASGDRLMTLAQTDCLGDMKSNSCLDFTQPWWGNFISESLTVNDRLFFTSGDILPTFYQSVGCFFYNIDLGANFGIDKNSLAQNVKDGKFTWEYMTQLVKNTDANLNDDDILSADIDRFGLVTYNVYNHTNMWAIGAGLKLAQQDSSGEWLVDFESSGVVSTLAELAKYVGYTEMGKNGDDSIMQTTFKSGRAIFAEHFTESAFSTLRDMQNDYLMLPVPKLYETQDSYRCMVNSYVNCFVGILNNCADETVTGALLESMAYYGYHDIRPVAYEEFLKAALARDEAARELIDIIFDTAYIDYGVIEKFGVSDEYKEGASTILYLYLKEDKPLASAFAANKSAINSDLNKALESFTK